MHLHEIHYLTFDFDLVVKVIKNVAQYPLLRVTYALQSLKLLCPTVWKIHLQENTLFDPDFGAKVTQYAAQYGPSTSYDLCTCKT